MYRTYMLGFWKFVFMERLSLRVAEKPWTKQLRPALANMALPYRDVAGRYNPCHLRPVYKDLSTVTICF